ncbi:MAG TPA: two-component regulator propeller domain-containing protein [Niastella sp.]
MKLFKRSFTIFFLLATCCASLTWAQSDVITSYGPNSITRNIIQDRNVHIWIASFKGIFKYDGKSFTNITNKVSSARFFSILEDGKGNLWFGSMV